jgi:hypothetical protein
LGRSLNQNCQPDDTNRGGIAFMQKHFRLSLRAILFELSVPLATIQAEEKPPMQPMTLFGVQFTLSLVAFLLIGFWTVAPRLSKLPREAAVVPLLWVHAFRIVGGTILARVP